MTIVVFNCNNRAASYGVGTYLKTLMEFLKDMHANIYMVTLFSNIPKIQIKKSKGYTSIDIPMMNCLSDLDKQRYTTNIPCILEELMCYKKEEKVIFHLNYMSDPYLVSALRKRFRKSKIILVAHYSNWSFELFGNLQKLNKILQKPAHRRNLAERNIVHLFQRDVRMIKSVDKFVCVAKHTLTPYLKWGKIPFNKCQIIHNGIRDEFNGEVSKQKLRKEYGISETDQILLFVGRLDEVKGGQVLLESYTIALEKEPNLHLIIVGDGDFCKWFSFTKKICTHVSFVGKLDRREVLDFYQLADIGIVPSLHEEFGLVAIEMMMNKLPIIVSDQGGLSEIVQHKIDGLKLPVLYDDSGTHISPKDLADNILFLIRNDKVRQSIGLNARTSFIEKFEYTHFCKKIENLYNTI